MTASHLHLDNGVELAVLHLPERRAMALEIRMLAGLVNEPDTKLGLAHLVQETLDKGTQKHDGRSLSDAFDEIGAAIGSWCGREMTGFTSLCLPSYFARAVELHAEYLRTPVFPESACEVAVQLAQQELLTLQDDAQSLADKLINRQAFGPLLGRHPAGESSTLDTIAREDFVRFWKENYCAGRMVVSVAGPLAAEEVARVLETHFAGFGSSRQTHRDPAQVQFDARARHHLKETEQEQIAIALRAVPINHADYSAQRLMLGVLSGGMSSRLFTEVREKLGLAYWVGAWSESPRGTGMILLGASTTPQRCDQTYATLLKELIRVGQDVQDEEIERAITGILVRADVRGDITRLRCSEQADDLIHFGRPVPWEEKRARLEAVTAEDIRRFCDRYVTGAARSVVTLGPRALDNEETAGSSPDPSNALQTG